MRFPILLAFVGTTLLLACGSSFDDYCTKETNCRGGNDKDKQACVDSAETAKKEASDYGCSSQFSDLQNCALASSTCSGGQFSSSGCDAQSTALDNCLKAATAENKGLPGH